MSGAPQTPEIEKLDADLAALAIEGHWKSNQDGLPAEPGGTAQPFIWHWDMLYPNVLRAGELLGTEAGASRRTLRLCTPGVPGKATTRTIHTSIQMVKPGEVAQMHRHSISAFRFVISGSGGVTMVDGQRFAMEPNDLVLTPQWCWHEHSNDAVEPMIWIDGHDMPLMRALDTIFFQSSKAHNHPDADEAERQARARPFVYRGEDYLAQARALGAAAWSPTDGRVLEYRDPVGGGATMPTIMCRLHRFDAGEATLRHRHTASSVYYVVEGRGTTTVGDTTLDWRAGDLFVVPNWLWHSHRIASGAAATLFSASDDPILAALGHLRSERATTAETGLFRNGERRHG